MNVKREMNKMDDYRKTILHATPIAAMYEQLAEEAVELAHAAMKVARIYRNESPTPVSMANAEASLNEELADTEAVISILGLETAPVKRICNSKIARWADRINRKCGETTEV